MQTDWPPEHSQALREFIAAGLSFGRAMAAINAKFNTGYTRNAVIGRARRLGLAGQCGSHPMSSRAPENDGPRPRDKHVRAAMSWPFRPLDRTDSAKLRYADIEPRHLAITELEGGDCRYPYGGDAEDEAITFCGHPRRAGSSYCNPHFHLTRIPLSPADRALGPVLRRLVVAINETPITAIAARLRRLPPHHRIAHLRALIRRPSIDSARRERLVVLLHEAQMASPAPARH